MSIKRYPKTQFDPLTAVLILNLITPVAFVHLLKCNIIIKLCLSLIKNYVRKFKSFIHIALHTEIRNIRKHLSRRK